MQILILFFEITVKITQQHTW